MQRSRSEIAPGFHGVDFDIPMIGLRHEHHHFSAALRKRESVLLVGPGGAGKTKLATTVIQENPMGSVLYASCPPALHDLLVSLSHLLLDTGHPAFAREAGVGRDREAWMKKQTSVHLKGLLWTAFGAEPAILFLDGIDGAGFRTFRFLQRLYYARGMAVCAAARDLRSLGALSRLFWDPRQILTLQPLSTSDATELFESAADRFQLRQLNLDEFREKVLASARGNPGQIVEMCRLAADPKYVSGKNIKFAPLRIDATIRFAGYSFTPKA
jgi:hypothetical protein